VLELLFKLMYQVSLQQGITSFYAVAESSLLTILRRKFCLPFQLIGNPHTFPDGTKTRAAFAYVSDIEQALGDRGPEKLEWYRTLS
jgi:N-acyl-L-homoserine lactone synthetase